LDEILKSLLVRLQLLNPVRSLYLSDSKRFEIIN